MKRLLWLLAVLPLLGGCTTPTTYSWGHYEELIYVSYAQPGKLSPQMEVEQMEADYQKARSANKPVPPGWHAQLGYLYFQLGKSDQARQEFLTEEANFPESKVFMDRLLAKLNQP